MRTVRALAAAIVERSDLRDRLPLLALIEQILVVAERERRRSRVLVHSIQKR